MHHSSEWNSQLTLSDIQYMYPIHWTAHETLVLLTLLSDSSRLVTYSLMDSCNQVVIRLLRNKRVEPSLKVRYQSLATLSNAFYSNGKWPFLFNASFGFQCLVRLSMLPLAFSASFGFRVQCTLRSAYILSYVCLFSDLCLLIFSAQSYRILTRKEYNNRPDKLGRLCYCFCLLINAGKHGALLLMNVIEVVG